MKHLPLAIAALLCACSGHADLTAANTAPVVRDVLQGDHLFHLDWTADTITATLIDDGARPEGRRLLGLGISVIQRTTRCTVTEARLRRGGVTVAATLDCTRLSVVNI
jgi:hypothetical protein